MSEHGAQHHEGTDELGPKKDGEATLRSVIESTGVFERIWKRSATYPEVERRNPHHSSDAEQEDVEVSSLVHVVGRHAPFGALRSE